VSIKLIKSLYDPYTTLPNDIHFYESAMEDIEYFGISSQVYFLLKQQGKLEQTPDFFKKRLTHNYNESLFKNIFIKNQTEQILHEFETVGIDIIPLKGIRLAEKYFGHLGARATSDIDLLIKFPDLDLAIECVKLLGFTVDEEWIPDHFHCSFSKDLPGSRVPLTVEIHWDLMKETTSNFKIKEFWNQAKLRKKFNHVSELSDYHTFYMICLHGWRHNLDSPKYFIDIIHMIHQFSSKLDYQTLLTDAASHKTLKRIVRTLSIVYQQFPHLDEIREFPQKRTTIFWDFENFRDPKHKSVKKYVDFIDYQFLSYDSVKHSLVEVLNFIGPSK
jgi:hypothetical protein